MTANALVTGQFFKAPEQRASKSGKQFVKATLRAKDGDSSQFWTVMAFGETAQAELMRLRDGDSLSAQGGFKAELYRPSDGGDARISLTLFADAVLPLRSAPKPRRESDAEKPAAPTSRPPAYDDDIPF
jgi:Single-strand binding protein family